MLLEQIGVFVRSVLHAAIGMMPEPERESLRQRGLRIIHENAEVRRVYRSEYRDLADAYAQIRRVPGTRL